MKLFLTKEIKKWFDSEKGICENDLKTAAQEIANGIFEANLGGNIYKKRISNNLSKGKSGGSRLIIAYKNGNNLFFMYAFNKNEASNINDKEKIALKARAKIYFGMTKKEIEKAIYAKVFYVLDGELS